MRTRSHELLWALLAILIITALYTLVVFSNKTIPAARGFFGHALGLLGFLLMLMTEILYSLRKRSRSARWGRMASWLQFHIFTGLVGPYLVLLHTSWIFNGLAGVVMLMTVIIVVSGFIGRYIYTAVPRTADGVVLQAREIAEQIHLLEAQLQLQITGETAVVTLPHGVGAPLLAQGESHPTYRNSGPNRSAQATALKQLADQRRKLQRQLDSLASTRRMLATWHSIHIPIGVALFTAAIIHAAGAVYYATLLH